ncbi:MAG: SLOG family protein [bacterium]|nr:SLOG family protein [bacterium]
MKCIVAGSRSITDYCLVEAAIAQAGFHITEVVSGTASGVDQLGEGFAAAQGLPVRRFPADWRQYGRRAGIVRNLRMLAYASQAPEGGAVIAVWDGVSRGTRHTIEAARQQGLSLFVFRTDRL